MVSELAFSHTFVIKFSCITFFGGCMGNSFPNGFEFKLDLNPGNAVTNLISELPLQ